MPNKILQNDLSSGQLPNSAEPCQTKIDQVSLNLALSAFRSLRRNLSQVGRLLNRWVGFWRSAPKKHIQVQVIFLDKYSAPERFSKHFQPMSNILKHIVQKQGKNALLFQAHGGKFLQLHHARKLKAPRLSGLFKDVIEFAAHAYQDADCHCLSKLQAGHLYWFAPLWKGPPNNHAATETSFQCPF